MELWANPELRLKNKEVSGGPRDGWLKDTAGCDVLKIISSVSSAWLPPLKYLLSAKCGVDKLSIGT